MSYVLFWVRAALYAAATLLLYIIILTIHCACI